MTSNLNTRKFIGEIGVDAGLCWIGDPCYILHKQQPPKAIGNSWEEFCDILHDDDQYPTCKQFCYDLGHAGLGIVVSTGYGDGVYPVYAEFSDDGRIAKVWVEFIDQDESVAEVLRVNDETARLREAAPTLLKALIAASDWIDARVGHPRIEIQAQVREAIALATVHDRRR